MRTSWHDMMFIYDMNASWTRSLVVFGALFAVVCVPAGRAHANEFDDMLRNLQERLRVFNSAIGVWESTREFGLNAARDAEESARNPNATPAQQAELSRIARDLRAAANGHAADLRNARDSVQRVTDALGPVRDAQAAEQRALMAAQEVINQEERIAELTRNGASAERLRPLRSALASMRAALASLETAARTAAANARAVYRSAMNPVTWMAALTAAGAAITRLGARLAALLRIILPWIARGAAGVVGGAIGAMSLWGQYQRKIDGIIMACVQLRNCRDMQRMMRERGMPVPACAPTEREIQNTILELSRDAAALAAIYNAIPFLDDITPPIPRCAP